MNISQLELWGIIKKNMVLNCKKNCNLTNKYDSKSMFLNITLLNQWYLFGHAARAILRGWSSVSFAGGNWETCGRMEKTKRTPLNNLNLKREEGIASSNTCLHSDLRKAQDRTGWCHLIVTTTFWHGICQWWWWWRYLR